MVYDQRYTLRLEIYW